MNGKPYQSSLIPYENEIIDLRCRRPPMPYSQIAALLNEKYKLSIHRSSIFDFIKRRVKTEYKPCKYDARNIKKSEANNQPATEAKVIKKPIASKPPVPDKPKQPEAELDVSQLPELTYSDTYKLTRLSNEDAAKWLKIIEERKKQ